MHPYLFDWVVAGHHLRVPTFGVMLALAFSISYFEAIRRAIKLEENPKHIENLFLLVVLGSIVGSRLFHVVFEELPFYQAHPSKIFAVWEGGYTLYGAFLTSMLCIYLYCKTKHLSVLGYFDIAMCAATLGIAIGRLGCFSAGCCWGRPTDLPWGVVFSNPEAFTDVHDQPLHPTQLYESFSALLLFIYSQWRFQHRKYDGQVAFQGMCLYALSRFLIEFLRGDSYRGFIFGGALSYGQFISLLLLPFGVLGMVLFSKK